MQLASKRFIRWILALHLALLLVVALVVVGAARSVHNGARAEGLEQAKLTQELLAKQTARGIENYYQAITSVLELLKPTQEEEMGSGSNRPNAAEIAISGPPGPPSSSQPGGILGEPGGFLNRITGRGGEGRPPDLLGGPNEGPRTGGEGNRTNLDRRAEGAALRKRLVETIWNDVQQRVCLLFVLDLTGTHTKPGAPPSTDPATMRLTPHDAVGDEHGLTAEQVVAAMDDWFRHVDKSMVSPFQQIGGLNCNVIAVPIRAIQSRRMLVAVVPIDRIQKELLANLNAREATTAILFDDHGTIMSDEHNKVVGLNVHTENETPRITALAEKYMPTGIGGTEQYEHFEKVGATMFPPSLITIAPIEFKQFSGVTWWIAIASGLGQVDFVVNHIFGQATMWAVFVVISVTAILVSTGTQLIRARLRLERVQHEILERELNQAREIQLNWLPRDTRCRSPIEVAAVNRPANRISGDFYNWFELEDQRTVVVIGDVTGHGMAAAFLMATTQLLVRSTMARVSDPGQCLEEVNRQLCTQGFNGQFVTMTLLVLDTKNQAVEIANAGHPAPLFADGEGFRKIEIEPELVLGVDPEATFPTQRMLLPRDARIVLYTDGVVDAATMAGTRFRMTGLLASLAREPFETAQAIVDAVTDAVDRFRHGQDLSDDLTLVAVQLRSPA